MPDGEWRLIRREGETCGSAMAGVAVGRRTSDGNEDGRGANGAKKDNEERDLDRK